MAKKIPFETLDERDMHASSERKTNRIRWENPFEKIAGLETREHMRGIRKIHPGLADTLRKKKLTGFAGEIKKLLQDRANGGIPSKTAKLIKDAIKKQRLGTTRVLTLLGRLREKNNSIPTHEALEQLLKARGWEEQAK
ncbi:hypothetical protein HY993_03915 [Candidatus Micrarchaeota archaeon]|nr:hypothetical protein [Candidatus Micrarchaeota archaeon]